MSNFGTPPVIPEALRQYKYVFLSHRFPDILSRNQYSSHPCSSYVEDPKWQRKFSAVWATACVLAIIASFPYFIHSVRNGRAFAGLFGVSEDLSGKTYAPISAAERTPTRRRRNVVVWAESALSTLRWTLPGIELSFGQSEYLSSHVFAYSYGFA